MVHQEPLMPRACYIINTSAALTVVLLKAMKVGIAGCRHCQALTFLHQKAAVIRSCPSEGS